MFHLAFTTLKNLTNNITIFTQVITTHHWRVDPYSILLILMIVTHNCNETAFTVNSIE